MNPELKRVARVLLSLQHWRAKVGGTAHESSLCPLLKSGCCAADLPELPSQLLVLLTRLTSDPLLGVLSLTTTQSTISSLMLRPTHVIPYFLTF